MKIIIFCLISMLSIAADKQDVEVMMQQFEEKGLLKGVDLEQAKASLSNITPEQWQQINALVAKHSSNSNNMPVANNIDTASQKIDTNSKEFQEIQKQLRLILRK